MIATRLGGPLPRNPSATSSTLFSRELIWSCVGARRAAFEIGLDFFERFALCFRQEKHCDQEVNDSEAGEKEKHGRVSILAHKGQENSGERSGDKLVDDQRDAHSIGADAGGHELGKSDPDNRAGADGEESHEEIKAECHKPTMTGGGNTRDDGLLDTQGSGPRNLQVAKWILEKGLERGGGNTIGAIHFEARGNGIVGSDEAGGGRESAIGVNDGERGASRLDFAVGVVLCG